MDEYRYRRLTTMDFPVVFVLRDTDHTGWLNRRLAMVSTWCRERYGQPRPGGDGARWWLDTRSGDVMFRYDQDAIEFSLRWC